MTRLSQAEPNPTVTSGTESNFGIAITESGTTADSDLSVSDSSHTYINLEYSGSVQTDYISNIYVCLKRRNVTGSLYVGAFRTFGEWENDVTWNEVEESNEFQYNAVPMDYQYITEAGGTDGWFYWDVTELVRYYSTVYLLYA